jgi:hypothetical protein|uniref:Uncharacterized protein n=1 Tax=Picea glauca TaxID=3330 RepID=A0A101M3G2_PICGL|nr:hypothetical protein ABT39_MTgene30 [Picea glauca]QHR89342.1 hypothetical protein Q903MT_gene3363 [Picea sitchensis]
MPPLDHLLALVHWHYKVVNCHYRSISKLLVGPGTIYATTRFAPVPVLVATSGYRTVRDVGDSAYGVFASPATFAASLFGATGPDAGST